MTAAADPPADRIRVVVGRVGRAHGIHGWVSVEVRTDEPEVRFAPGSQLLVGMDGGRTVTVAETRSHAGRLLVRLAGIDDRGAAESLRGATLTVAVDPHARPGQAEEWYDHQLVGLTAEGPGGRAYGEVTEVVHLPMQDLLAVRTPVGEEVLVPFVAALVTDVDLEGGRVVLEPPGGLFEEG